MSYLQYYAAPVAPPLRTWPLRPFPSRTPEHRQRIINAVNAAPTEPPQNIAVIPIIPPPPFPPRPAVLEDEGSPWSEASPSNEVAPHVTSQHLGLQINNLSRTIQKKGTMHDFSAQQKEILYNWWVEHFHFPRPTREDLEDLAKTCKVHVSKVYKWFDNQRTRYLAKNGDAPFLGATKRGRPAAGQRDQPIVIDVRSISDQAEACQKILEEAQVRIPRMLHAVAAIDFLMCVVEPSVIIMCVSIENHSVLDDALRDFGAVRFRHAAHGNVLVLRPTPVLRIAQMWPAIRQLLQDVMEKKPVSVAPVATMVPGLVTLPALSSIPPVPTVSTVLAVPAVPSLSTVTPAATVPAVSHVVQPDGS